MKVGFRWCRFCRQPHSLDEKVCPTTGRPIDPHIVSVTGPIKEPGLVGETLNHKYEILRRIGTGGSGEVFQAYDREAGRTVAIKVMGKKGPGARARFLREAKIIAALQHPHICGIFDVGLMANGEPYLVLEHLSGETLEQRIRKNHGLSIVASVQVFAQILAALHRAHEAGILHRDLKPANVFLVDRTQASPMVKLLDFGMAKEIFAGSRESATGDTSPGRICGTPAYMSPEQVLASELTPRSDLYSFGVLMFETLTGRHPFPTSSILELSEKILREPCPDPCVIRPSIPRPLGDLVLKTMAKVPKDRPASAEAVLRELSQVSIRDDDDDDMDQVTLTDGLPWVATSSGSSVWPPPMDTDSGG